MKKADEHEASGPYDQAAWKAREAKADMQAIMSGNGHPDERPCVVCGAVFDTHDPGCIFEVEAKAEAREPVGWLWDSDPGKPNQERHYHNGPECPDFADSSYCSTPVPVYTRPAPAANTEGLRQAAEEVWDSIPATWGEDDPMVKRHARALNKLRDALASPSAPSEGVRK